ncbi:glycoside hydrolase [Novosphingobium album (ex Hu et al. 2023)]|uniref:Glycoside hydrolase n=1 Tax=Novosphingobium album (ex Hu et al. 2023) TaxID=2930093 RepID=A0ABT0B4G4_9SPHN|nr:glycoside hydrolase [Novosphingobium album (ex Hu et al. 2023)]MCJ2179790.1 glycoside hydrolase [Novosphingobium album (ex Hu et al. 2023)]
MALTFIGWLELAIGIILLIAGSLRSTFAFMLLTGLLGGSAAILLPSLGGSSIPPLELAILFVYVRMLSPERGNFTLLYDALWANSALLLFTAYGIAIAFLGPHLFAGQINVTPMRVGEATGLFDTDPLMPSSQNITSAFYMFGSLLVAIAAHTVCRRNSEGLNTMISAGIAIGWWHIALGIIDLITRDTSAATYLDLMRNGNYAQLDQSSQGFVRIRGLFTETSAFAEFGFGYFVLSAELWYRSIRPRATGILALCLAAILFFSTSSTAYVSLFAYVTFVVARMLLLPQMVEGSRVRQIAFSILAGGVMVAVLMLSVPELPSAIGDLVLDATVNKSTTSSGQQRLFWALQGWDAFKVSYGLGIGPGSFRSSSMITAILGSMGVIGVVTFTTYLILVFAPWRVSTFARAAEPQDSVGGAFAVAALLCLAPAAVASPKPDPGTNFGFFAGVALASRSRKTRSHAPHPGRRVGQHPAVISEKEDLLANANASFP